MEEFWAAGQLDNIKLQPNQLLDLSSERMLGTSLSTFALTNANGSAVAADAYKEDKFNFRFLKSGDYQLKLQNSVLPDVDFTWCISVKDGAANESHESDNFYVYAQDRNIVLSEIRGAVQVFNAVGQCVYSGNATIIPVRQSGVYVVRVGTNAYKVIVR